MRTIVCVLVLGLASAVAADEFYLDDAKGKTHGPFELKKGTEIRVGKEKLTVSRVKTEEEALLETMKEIRIPEIDFRQAHITDVVEFLQDSSIALDKKKRGVNMLLNLGPGPEPKAEPDPFGEEFAAAAAVVREVPLITFKGRDVTLLDAVKVVTSITGLKYRCMGNMLMIVPKDAPDGDILVRMYSVTPTFLAGTREIAGFAPAQDFEPGANEPENLKAPFTEMGVQWPTGSSIRYVPAIGKVVVANTAHNLAVFERALWIMDVVPTQLELEMQFVAFDQTNIAKLAKSRIDVAGLTHLWASGRGELLAAPRVVTKSGCEAVVKAVTECIYPTEFTIADPRGTNTNATVTASTLLPVAEPSGFEMREVGVIFEVAPDVSPEGDTIDVTFTPSLVEEPVWEDYGGKCVGPDGKVYQISMRQPFFHQYGVSTSVSVADGGKVLVGGGMLSRDRKKVVYMFLSARRIGLEGESAPSAGGVK